MIDWPAKDRPRELCGQLLEMTRAQVAALAAGDLDSFALLARQRTTFCRQVLKPAVARIPTRSAPPNMRPALAAVAALDRQMSVALLTMFRETGR